MIDGHARQTPVNRVHQHGHKPFIGHSLDELFRRRNPHDEYPVRAGPTTAVPEHARPIVGTKAAGVGELTASLAVRARGAANPNKALEQFVAGAGTTSLAFDSASWLSTVQASASWDTASWDTASWEDASWDTASWEDASWEDASWLDASWNDASWLDASWLDASWEDAAEGDASSDPAVYTMSVGDASALAGDPALATDPSVLPPATP